MEEITDLSYNSVVRYFETLRKFGCMDYSEVYKLIVLLHIEEIPDMFSDYITEQDLKEIISAVNCIGGTCLTDLPSYCEGISLINGNKVNYLMRLSETQRLMMTDDKNFYCL